MNISVQSNVRKRSVRVDYKDGVNLECRSNKTKKLGVTSAHTL